MSPLQNPLQNLCNGKTLDMQGFQQSRCKRFCICNGTLQREAA